MDRSNSSKPLSLFPLQTVPHITDEAFNLFHSVDRELFTRLIHNLGRDAAQSVQVVAFWLWLEMESKDMNLIRRVMSLPAALLNDLADETGMCLKCVETDRFPFGGDAGVYEITMLPNLLSNPVVSLRFFHDHRISVLRGVAKIITTVCSRAFKDILRRTVVAADGGAREVRESSRVAPAVMPRQVLYHHPQMDVQPTFVTGGGLTQMQSQPPLLPSPHVLPPGQQRPPLVADAIGIPIPMGFPVAYDLVAHRQMLSNELGEMLSRYLTISAGAIARDNGGHRTEEVAADDRTIFLTFSKGYPISEDEVREFFIRRFGDFIEDLIMQEVGEDEQVLYARMVARSLAVIDGIVGGSKAKYTINGKHVWARKYVKKPNQHSASHPQLLDLLDRILEST